MIVLRTHSWNMDSNIKIRSSNFPNICRVCLIAEPDLKPLLDGPHLRIFKAVSEIEISAEDTLPKNICSMCSNYLQEIKSFSEKCKENDEVLRQVIENEQRELELTNLVNKYLVEPIEDDTQSSNIIDIDGDNSPEEETFLIYVKEEETADCDISICEENLESIEDDQTLGQRSGCKRKPVVETDDDATDSIIPVCNACGRTFLNKTSLGIHYKDNVSCRPKDFKLFKCEICGKEYSRKRARSEHMISHTGEVPYICTYCGKGSQTYRTHTEHVYRHRLALGEVEPTLAFIRSRKRPKLKCELCNKIFASRSGFVNHKLIHEGKQKSKQRNFLCNHCGKTLRTKFQLENHERLHTGEQPFQCAYCPMAFVTRARLELHEMKHSGNNNKKRKNYSYKTFKCEPCNKMFTKDHYEVHSRMHTGEKPFSCDFCGKRFNSKGTWRVHVRIHTGETPFACPVCDMKYHDKSSLSKHQRKKGHPGEAVRLQKDI